MPHIATSFPTLILHTQGSELSDVLAHELAAAGFRLAIASDAGIVCDQGFEVVIARRDRLDTSGIIDEVRRYFPGTRIVSIVTVGEVTVVHAFASVPPAAERDRLRGLAVSVRKAVRNAAAALASTTR